jgi:dienelactone hydrolase
MIHRGFLLSLTLLVACPSVYAEVVTRELDYREGDTVMQGMLAYDDALEGRRPGVLVVHEWWGQNDYARKRARMLAALGYTALAVDMYGEGKTATHPDDAGKFASAVGGNLPLAKARFEAALAALRDQPTVAEDKIAAIGYCFGGGIVINMARLGTDIDGVVSYHGSLATSEPAGPGDITTRLLVFNGADDPLVTPEQIEAFKQEMDAAGADYEFVNYPGAVHSFTNPGADEAGKRFGLPLAYDPEADRDSWQRTQAFFVDIFSED